MSVYAQAHACTLGLPLGEGARIYVTVRLIHTEPEKSRRAD